MVIFHSYVKLPEGNWNYSEWQNVQCEPIAASFASMFIFNLSYVNLVPCCISQGNPRSSACILHEIRRVQNRQRFFGANLIGKYIYIYIYVYIYIYIYIYIHIYIYIGRNWQIFTLLGVRCVQVTGWSVNMSHEERGKRLFGRPNRFAPEAVDCIEKHWTTIADRSGEASNAAVTSLIGSRHGPLWGNLDPVFPQEFASVWAIPWPLPSGTAHHADGMLLCGSTRGERTYYGTHVGSCESLGLTCQHEHIASRLPFKLDSLKQEHDFGQVHIIILRRSDSLFRV